MPLALISAVLAIINKVVKDPQEQAKINLQVTGLFYQYQSDFISKTSDILNRALRVAIVAAFSAALFNPEWGRTLADNARAMPTYFWLIIGWEFYGAAMLQALPWFKSGNGAASVASAVTGNDPVPSPTAILPSDMLPKGGDRN